MDGPKHTEEEVKIALAGEIARTFETCIRDAWAEYHDKSHYSSKALLLHCKRTRASIIYDHVRGRLVDALADLPRAKVQRVRGLDIVVVDDQFIVKIPKRLTRKRVSRTYPTAQTLAFMTQGKVLQEAFPFLTSRTTLIVGYVLDKLELEIESIHVACPKSTNKNHFAFKLEAPAAAPAAALRPGLGLPDSALPLDEDEKKESGK